jgi:hypothetical protein
MEVSGQFHTADSFTPRRIQSLVETGQEDGWVPK